MGECNLDKIEYTELHGENFPDMDQNGEGKVFPAGKFQPETPTFHGEVKSLAPGKMATILRPAVAGWNTLKANQNQKDCSIVFSNTMNYLGSQKHRNRIPNQNNSLNLVILLFFGGA